MVVIAAWHVEQERRCETCVAKGLSHFCDDASLGTDLHASFCMCVDTILYIVRWIYMPSNKAKNISQHFQIKPQTVLKCFSPIYRNNVFFADDTNTALIESVLSNGFFIILRRNPIFIHHNDFKKKTTHFNTMLAY